MGGDRTLDSLYMDEQLRLDPAVRGVVIGIQPLVELAISGVQRNARSTRRASVAAKFAFLAVIGLVAMARSGVLESGPAVDQR